MRMPVDAKYVLNLALWAVGFVGMIRALIWMPLLVFTPVIWVCLALGALPLLFFDRNYRQRYLCFCVLMSGAGGLLYLGGQYLNCSIGAMQCAFPTDNLRLVSAISIYAVLAVVGILWLRRLTVRSKDAAGKHGIQP